MKATVLDTIWLKIGTVAYIRTKPLGGSVAYA